jgi:hypothetical protein
MEKGFVFAQAADADRSVASASAGVAVEHGLTEAELDRIAAAGTSSNGSLRGGGNMISAAEWPPPPSRLN